VLQSNEDINVSIGTSMSTDAAVDLQQLLEELAQYSSTTNQTSHGLQQESTHAEQNAKELLGLQQLQSVQPLQYHQAPQTQNQRAPIVQSTNANRIVDPRLSVQQHQATTPPAQSSRPPPIDPAVILDWPQALRCINKVAAHNPHLAAAINGVSAGLCAYLLTILICIQMMADQERNVQQWWKDREALLVRQAGRVQSIKELNETM
jgi:hypothetical protein